jgi:hypothetical protein
MAKKKSTISTTRTSITFSYDPQPLNITDAIARLVSLPDTPYTNRSQSYICKVGIGEWLDWMTNGERDRVDFPANTNEEPKRRITFSYDPDERDLLAEIRQISTRNALLQGRSVSQICAAAMRDWLQTKLR